MLIRKKQIKCRYCDDVACGYIDKQPLCSWHFKIKTMRIHSENERIKKLNRDRKKESEK